MTESKIEDDGGHAAQGQMFAAILSEMRAMNQNFSILRSKGNKKQLEEQLSYREDGEDTSLENKMATTSGAMTLPAADDTDEALNEMLKKKGTFG
mgnify:FL=1